ncbi:uncharacterized protein YcbK (DUF882 family) [Novosphingobium chloroacetimidivorans]|uniref:Uncharacterized protein YcbK (DUF882 family) n=1 Tax=Novosphingobium chloroacetimidivorans TaxID=1428314 RepID=A0A7W7K979_9SPHN|nr:D-Ala-D-Ala carboxypeptidase family metallohydrolase [Novosphingobium chloroacetimidivorans]MBB4858256.1 uncharacterized protein YcbK (DUF882 family) [Novosphingobium chloroacetimidivorans]
MAGIQAGNAGRLSIEIVAEVARLQADMDKVRRLVKDASGDIAKSARHANDNLAGMSGGLNKASGSARGFSLQMSQVGQQVMAGTSLIQALAMQLPDVAAGMNAGTAGGSKFAAFLGGPWGIALTSAIGLAATFAVKLFDTDDAAKKAEKGQRSFVDVLSDSKSSWEQVTKAARDYADQQKNNRQITFDMIREEAAVAASNLRTAISTRQKLAAELEYFQSVATRGAQSEAGEAARSSAMRTAESLREQIAKNAAGMRDLTDAANEASIKVATAIAEMNVDPAAKTRAGYDQLEKQAKDRYKSVGQLTARLTELGKGEEAALERASQANRKHADETIKLAKVTGAEIAKALGAPITSGFRTKDVNDAVKGAKNSYHLTGQAIDIPLSVGGRPFTKAGIRAALAPLGVQIKELLGPGDKGHGDHFHIAFGVKRLAPDQVAKLETDAAEAATKAAEKAKDELERFRTDILATSYEMESALAKALLPGFLAAEQRVWDEFIATVEKSANAGVEGATDAQQAWAYWNDELRDTVDLLDDIGTSGRGLGDIAATLAGLTSGDWSGSRGPLGSLMRTLGNVQWRDPSDANGLGQIRVLRDEIVGALDKVFGGKGSFAKMMTNVLQNAGTGMAAASLVFGKQTGAQKAGSAVGGAIGGGLGKMAGDAIGKAVGGSLGKALGGMAGPLGSMLGGVLGSVVGGLFKKVKWGRVDLTSAGVSATSGNSGSSEKAALQTGNSIFNGLKDLATQLGGVLGDFGSISVGVRHGDYRVNTGGTSLKKKKGAVDFDDDAEAAAAYAMKEAIERGAITGIRNSTNNLLKAGDDLQAQLQKAMSFEGVFSELKGITDPVGAALDEVNKQFDQLRVVFKEAGATAEEYAQLEQLLSIRRQEALDKEKDALDDIRSRIAEAQGDDATVKLIARTKELKDALNDNVRAELQRLYAVEDATEAQQKLTDAQAEAAAKADQLRDAWASIGADLMDEVNRIRGLTGTDGANSFAALQGQFNAAVGAARGGDQAAAGKLANLSQSLIEAAQNAARSQQELDRVKTETAAALEGVARLAGAPATQVTGLPSGGAQSEATAAEMRETREELAAMLQQLLVALAAIAGNTAASTTILRNVTPAGDAISVAQAA